MFSLATARRTLDRIAPTLRCFTLGLGVLALVAGLGACGEGPPVNDGGTDAIVTGDTGGTSLISAPTAAAIQSEFLMLSCNFSSCHNAAGHRAQLVLTDLATTCKNLINVPATTAGAAAQKLMRVLPGDAENSFFYQKLAAANDSLGNYMDDPELPLGDRMPRNADGLDADTLATVAEWINNGAVCP